MIAPTITNSNNTINPVLKLWAIDYELPVGGMTSTVITNRDNAPSDLEKRKWTYLLGIFHALGVAQKEGADVKAKSELIKIGEHILISSDYDKILEQAEKSFKQLGLNISPTPDDQSTPESKSDPSILESYRATAYFLSTPLSPSLVSRFLEVMLTFLRCKTIPADLSYFMLYAIYKGLDDPAIAKWIDEQGSEFWEFFGGLAFKAMSRFLHDGTMEYIVYYELPPGVHNDIHLKRCQLFLDAALQCCQMLRHAYPKIKYQLDQHVYRMCVETIDNQDPHPIINFSYRLLDFSSEDFFITLPKDQINKYIRNSITRLESM